MNRDYIEWHSPSLNRKMEFLWFGHAGRPVILFPTSAGKFWENEDFGLVDSVADKVDRGEIQVVCVDTVNHESWFNKRIHPADRVRRHAQYDHYLRWELIPYIENRAGMDGVIVYGASFGAYHASNFAARYPDTIGRAICFSGVYDIHDFLDGYWNDDCYFNCPVAFIPNMNEHTCNMMSTVDWIVATGEYDMLVNTNRQFAGMLGSKGIRHYLELWPGQFGHDWPWWREHLRRFVP